MTNRSIKLNLLTLDMRFNNNVIPLEPKNTFSSSVSLTSGFGSICRVILVTIFVSSCFDFMLIQSSNLCKFVDFVQWPSYRLSQFMMWTFNVVKLVSTTNTNGLQSYLIQMLSHLTDVDSPPPFNRYNILIDKVKGGTPWLIG